MSNSRAVEEIDWEALRPDMLNANAGTERGMELLELSLRQYGPGGAVTVDAEGNIIGGNKTAEVAAELGLKPVRIKLAPDEVAVVERSDLDLYSRDDSRGRDLATALNRVAQTNLSWVDDMLKAAQKGGAKARETMWFPNELTGMAIKASKDSQKEAAVAEGEQTPLNVEPKAKRPAKPIVIVECADENQQAEVIDVCEERGWQWRTN